MVRVGLEIRLGGTPPYSAWEEIYTALFHQTVSTETEREKKKLNEKSAQRDANTARALAVVSSDTARPPVANTSHRQDR